MLMRERRALALAHVSGVRAARLLSFRGYELTAIDFCKLCMFEMQMQSRCQINTHDGTVTAVYL